MTLQLVPHDDHAWWGMLDAPKDGTPIRVLVQGGHQGHEFPYPVMWYGGCWCFAKNKGPLFPWQKPLRWKPAAGE